MSVMALHRNIFPLTAIEMVIECQSVLPSRNTLPVMPTACAIASAVGVFCVRMSIVFVWVEMLRLRYSKRDL